eukprot:tig00000350_g24312.t1
MSTSPCSALAVALDACREERTEVCHEKWPAPACSSDNAIDSTDVCEDANFFVRKMCISEYCTAQDSALKSCLEDSTPESDGSGDTASGLVLNHSFPADSTGGDGVGGEVEEGEGWYEAEADDAHAEDQLALVLEEAAADDAC